MHHKTIDALLSYATKHIERLDAEVLLAYILQKDRVFLLAHDEEPISSFKRLRFLHLVKKRVRNIPVAYLTHCKEFFGIPLAVNKHTLVPRGETEELVELTLKQFSLEESKRTCIFLDIGTGSGCIPIALAKTLSQKNCLPPQTIHFFASDISKKALRVAKRNALQTQTQIHFFRGSLLSPFLPYFQKNFSSARIPKLFLTANLPYLTEEQFTSEPSIQKEPKSALVALDFGLTLYKKFLEQLRFLADSAPVEIFCIMEIDPSQSQSLKKFATTLFPKAKIDIHKDLSSQARFITLTL